LVDWFVMVKNNKRAHEWKQKCLSMGPDLSYRHKKEKARSKNSIFTFGV